MKPFRPFRWQRRLWRILAAAAVVVLLLVLVLPNVLLALPFVRERVAAKVTAHVRLEADFTGATLTPWSGLRVRGLTLRPPAPAGGGPPADPVLSVREIQMWPEWRACLRGKPGFAGIVIREPKGTLPLELLVALMPPVEAVAPQQSQPLPLAAVEKAPPAPPPPASSRPAPLEAENPLPPPPPPPPAISTLDESARWIHVTGASLGGTIGGKEVFRVEGLAMDLPVAGPQAGGEVRWERLSLLGKAAGDADCLPVEWSFPRLSCTRTKLGLMGLEVGISAVAARQPGWPLVIELAAEGEAVEQDAGAWRAKTAGVKARAVFGGLLRLPASWQGKALATAGGVEVSMPAGDPLVFDGCQALALLQGGVLQCPDVRLTGERLSFLGNATVTRGGGAAVLRIVAAPDLAAAWEAKWSDLPGRRPAFLPLETPDRLHMDLRWISYPGVSVVEVGTGGPVVPAGDLLRAWGR